MRYKDWLRLLAINVFANVVIQAAFYDHAGPWAWQHIMVDAWPGFVISTTISGMCLVLLPSIAQGLHRWFEGSWTFWLVTIPILTLIAIVGSALAVAALITMSRRFGTWADFFPVWQDIVKIAIAMTLLFGIYGTVIEMLRNRLDRTTMALRTKERDEAEARRIASEAQLASLESRVNPHFFFNTLNSIAALTREDAGRAERMTTQLASLMRSSLDQSSRPLVPLEEELQNVRDYLEIEQVRFGDRLRFEIDIGDDAVRALVPRLALQTLVENSVKYAVSTQRDGASLTITAARENGRMRVSVTDDGPGFDAATIPDGHGLSLIKARLTMLYGGDATLTVQTRDGLTRVEMDMPAAHV